MTPFIGAFMFGFITALLCIFAAWVWVTRVVVPPEPAERDEDMHFPIGGAGDFVEQHFAKSGARPIPPMPVVVKDKK
jgi:hypothetical protein